MDCHGHDPFAFAAAPRHFFDKILDVRENCADPYLGVSPGFGEGGRTTGPTLEERAAKAILQGAYMFADRDL